MPAAVASPVVVSAPAAVAPVTTPMTIRTPKRARTPVETGAILFAPAASPDDGEYPYDWPTQEQLDQFEARRRASNHEGP